MSANDVTAGHDRSPEAVGLQGFQQIGKWPDVDPVRAAHASLTRAGQNPAAQARERGDGTESGQVAIVDARGRLGLDRDEDGIFDFDEVRDLDGLTPGIQNPFDPDDAASGSLRPS